jgi:vancomycin resistance protein VanJ
MQQPASHATECGSARLTPVSPSTAPLPPIRPVPGPAVPPADVPAGTIPPATVPPGASGPSSAQSARRPSGPESTRSRRRVRGIGLAVGTLLVGAGIAGYRLIPSLNGVGSAWTSFVPWAVVLVLLLGLIAVLRRAWWAVGAAVVAMTAWWLTFGPTLLPSSTTGTAADVTVVTQNIGAGSSDQAAAARTLAATGAGLIAVQEISDSAGEAAAAVLDAEYPYQARVGTVGVWSRWPLGETTPLELGLDWARGLTVSVAHPQGEFIAYVVHLPSVRPGDTSARDEAVAELSRLVAGQPAERVVVLGDLNTATTDPTIAPLTRLLADTRETVDGGFGFTWPAVLPLTRPDHVLVRGFVPVSDEVLAHTGSDHLAVVAGLRLS